MDTHADKTSENKSQSVAEGLPQMQNNEESTFQFLDNRPEAIAQRKLQEMANNSLQSKQAVQMQEIADKHLTQKQHPIQKKSQYQTPSSKINNSDLPENSKSVMDTGSAQLPNQIKGQSNNTKAVQARFEADKLDVLGKDSSVAEQKEPTSTDGQAPIQRWVANFTRARNHLNRMLVTEYRADQAFLDLSRIGDDGELAAAVTRLGDALVRSLLEHVSAGRRASPAFPRFIMALPVNMATNYSNWLMSASFDWMRTNDQAGRLFRILDAMGNARKYEFLSALAGNDTLRRVLHASNEGQHTASIVPFIQTLPRGEALSEEQKTFLRTLIAACPDGQSATIQAIVSCRFAFTVGDALAPEDGATPIAWEGAGLKRTYPILEALPPAHVGQNARFHRLSRYDQNRTASGYYQEANNEVAIEYQPDNMDRDFGGNFAAAGDPMRGQNQFNGVIRHEVGHAVEEQLGWKDQHAHERNRGEWATFDSTTAVAQAMVAASAGYISGMPAGGYEQHLTIAALAQAMDAHNIDQMGQDILATPALAPDHANIMTDPAIEAARIGLVGNSPWFNAPGGGNPLGARIYQESYEGNWTSYRAAARNQKVSNYQFRAPQEYFAEAYSAYYAPDPRGRGALLNDVNPRMKNWMDDYVHTAAPSR